MNSKIKKRVDGVKTNRGTIGERGWFSGLWFFCPCALNGDYLFPISPSLQSPLGLTLLSLCSMESAGKLNIKSWDDVFKKPIFMHLLQIHNDRGRWASLESDFHSEGASRLSGHYQLCFSQ